MKIWKTAAAGLVLSSFPLGLLAAGEPPAGPSWTELAGKTPNSFVEEKEGASLSAETLAAWWTVFHDDTLTDLISTALSNNKDLEAAQARVREARYAMGIQKAAAVPWVDAGGAWGRASVPENIPGKVVSTDLPLPISIRRTGTGGYAGLDASWEPDVFGRTSHKVKAAGHSLEVRRGALYGTWVTLSSEVAMNYFTLRTLQEELAVAETSAADQKEQLTLLQVNEETGLYPSLPVSQASYALAETEAQIPELRKNISDTLARISILTGTAPGALDGKLLTPRPLPDVDPTVYNAIPAQQLSQRPDIYAAEQALRAQEETTQAARAELRPRFNILGLLGLATLGAGGLFSSGARGFAVVPQVSYPLFNGGALRKNVKVQGEKEKELTADYENTVLKAAAEVRTTMAAISQDHDRTAYLAKGKTAAHDALSLSQNQFDSGLSDYMNVLDARRASLSFDSAYTRAKGQELIDLVALFKAMGGGWKGLDVEGITGR